jgi:hypothetical protein
MMKTPNGIGPNNTTTILHHRIWEIAIIVPRRRVVVPDIVGPVLHLHLVVTMFLVGIIRHHCHPWTITFHHERKRKVLV